MRKHLVLLGILGLALGLAGFAQQQRVSKVTTHGILTSGGTHRMGAACSGSDDLVCHLTVQGIRADEKNPHHSAVTLSVEKQDSLHISGDQPFTVEFVADDNGPQPFYRPVGKAAKAYSSGPARPESAGHKYHMVIRDEEGSYDPHIVICGTAQSTC